MATHVVFPGAHYEPEERASDRPVECATCHAEFDEDEDSDRIKMVGDEYFCVERTNGKPSCCDIAQAAAYRKEVAEAVTDTLKDALRDIEKIDRKYRNASPDDAEDHPITIIEDFIERLKAFGAGRDSGWRNGLMLSDLEARAMRRELHRDLDNAFHYYEWHAGRNEANPIAEPWPWLCGNNTDKVAHIGNRLLRLNEAFDRTEKGGQS